jgi:hypothetical protein
MQTKRVSLAPWWIVGVTATFLVYAWIAAGLRPFTTPEELLVALPVIPVVILTARRGRAGARPKAQASTFSSGESGAVVWVGLLVALAGWELIALFSSPRSDHPTMSSVADKIMSVHVGRTAVFALWLVLGAALALRPMWKANR